MISAASIASAITPADWDALRPVFWVAVGALLVLVADLISPKGASKFVCVLIGVASLVSAGVIELRNYHMSYSAFGGAYLEDGFSVVFSGIVIVATIFSLLLFYSFEKKVSPAGSMALMLWSACGAMVMTGAGNLMTIFLGLELLSLALYALCGMAIRQAAREAALKYLILSSMASAVMLYGMALIFGITGSVALSAFLTPPAGNALYPIAIGLFFIGVAFKLGLVPFHVWMPDVFEGAPLPVTAFMSIVTKAGMLAVFARVVYAAIPSSMTGTLLEPMWILAAISMLVGNLGALAQVNLKRLLAYSGIAQVGYIVAAFAGGTSYGLRYGMLYLAAYMFMNFGVFAVIAMLSDQTDEGARLVSYAGLGRRRPLLAAAMTFFLIGLAGLPPTIGFLGKILILASSINAGFAWLAGVLILGTAISIYAYFKIIRVMYTPLRHDVVAGGGAAIATPLPWVAIAICAVATLALAIYPLTPSAVLPIIK